MKLDEIFLNLHYLRITIENFENYSGFFFSEFPAEFGLKLLKELFQEFVLKILSEITTKHAGARSAAATRSLHK